MAKKNLKNGLRSSLQEEEKKVDDKFFKAEQHFKKKDLGKKEPQTVKPSKELKEKVIRDAFTFPPWDHALFAAIQKKAMEAGVQINKSEIVRAGLHCLDIMAKKDLADALGMVKKLKVGRK